MIEWLDSTGFAERFEVFWRPRGITFTQEFLTGFSADELRERIPIEPHTGLIDGVGEVCEWYVTVDGEPAVIQSYSTPARERVTMVRVRPYDAGTYPWEILLRFVPLRWLIHRVAWIGWPSDEESPQPEGTTHALVCLQDGVESTVWESGSRAEVEELGGLLELIGTEVEYVIKVHGDADAVDDAAGDHAVVDAAPPAPPAQPPEASSSDDEDEEEEGGDEDEEDGDDTEVDDTEVDDEGDEDDDGDDEDEDDEEDEDEDDEDDGDDGDDEDDEDDEDDGDEDEDDGDGDGDDDEDDGDGDGDDDEDIEEDEEDEEEEP